MSILFSSFFLYGFFFISFCHFLYFYDFCLKFFVFFYVFVILYMSFPLWYINVLVYLFHKNNFIFTYLCSLILVSYRLLKNNLNQMSNYVKIYDSPACPFAINKKCIRIHIIFYINKYDITLYFLHIKNNISERESEWNRLYI